MRRIGIIYNPISGAGKSAKVARRLAKKLSMEFECQLVESLSTEIEADFFASRDLIIVAGGDGTLQRYLKELSESQTPFYMIPTGNESLFAKEFGMTTDSKTLAKAIREKIVESHYLASVNGRLFFSMASIGFDSQVIQKISKHRTGPIKHRGYLWPIFNCFLKHKPPRLTLWADGKEVFASKSGFLIFANTKSYALGVPYVREASSLENILQARFIAYNSLLSFILQSIAIKLGMASQGELYKAAKFEVSADADYPIQADGESFGELPAEVIAETKQVRVLIPERC